MNKGKLEVRGSLMINKGQADDVQSYFIQDANTEVLIGKDFFLEKEHSATRWGGSKRLLRNEWRIAYRERRV